LFGPQKDAAERPQPMGSQAVPFEPHPTRGPSCMFDFTRCFDLLLPEGSRSARPTPWEIENFGTNPGSLQMFTYIPRCIGRKPPLVVVLHGATQTAADYAHGSGWLTLADRHGFALLFPQQRRSNNAFTCFHWYRRRDTERGQGEARSIWQMVERMIASHDIDRGSLFVTGLSAGGAMTNVMLATYPEAFAAGAIIAGLPYAAAYNLEEALRSMSPGTKRASADWGDRVRAASSHTGAWPKVSIWHGDADTTVHTVNARETVKQWVNVHGLHKEPTFSEQTTGCNHQVWCNERGERQIERYGIARMQHGTPLEPGNDGAKCGTAGRYFLDVGISSSWLIAKFWGLVDVCTVALNPPGALISTATIPVGREAPAGL
jgi:poly(hydroxyalkanoate) depolymerase family esterase